MTFHDELVAASKGRSAFTFRPQLSLLDGHLTADTIGRDLAPMDPDTHVLLCGPSAMVSDMVRGLPRFGIPREHIHAEHFAFR